MLKKILKSSSAFLTINVLSTIVQIALISVYVTSFSPREYGIYALLSSFIAFITIFSSGNLKAALQTYFYDFTEEKKRFLYLKSIFSTATLIAIITLIIFFIIGSTVFEYLFGDNDIPFNKYGLLVLCNAIIASINFIHFEFLRNSQAIKEYVWLMISQILISLVLQILFIRYLQLNVFGAFFGLLISNLVVFIYTVLKKKLITLDVDKKLVKQSLKYSLFLMPLLFIQWFMTRADRFIIENYIGLEEVGIYALMMNVTMIISILATSILNSLRPSLFASFKLKSGSSKKIFLHFTFYFGVISSVAFVLFFLIQNIEIFPIDKNYYLVKPIVGAGLLLFGIRVIVRFLNEYLIFRKKSKILSLLTFLGLLSYLILIVVNLEELTIALLLEILILSNTIVLIVTACIMLFQMNKQKAQLK